MIMPDRYQDRFHCKDVNYPRYSQSVISKAREEGKITADDASLIREFITEVQSTAQITPARAFKLTYILTNWRSFLGPFRENTIADVYDGIARLKEATLPSGKPYAQNTISDYMRFLKRFSLWMVENGYSEIPDKKLNRIRPPSMNTMTKTAEQMLTPDEVRGMLERCQNSRDRALVSMLYEGGFRIGEVGKLRWNQVKFNEWNVVVNVNEKTGRPRYIPLVISRAYIAQWKNDYPFEPTGDAFVFLTSRKLPLQYRGVAKQLATIAKRAGIGKHITPHIFRHSRITHLIQQGYSESIIKKMMWGNITTGMFATYAHLTDRDIENEVAVRQGIRTGEESTRDKALEPRQCTTCYTVNGPTQNYCGTCGQPLTEEGVRSQQDLLEALNAKVPQLTRRQLDEITAIVAERMGGDQGKGMR
jgi:integrase/recombinase XerD